MKSLQTPHCGGRFETLGLKFNLGKQVKGVGVIILSLPLDLLGRFPEKGEKLEVEGMLLVCEEVKKTAIVKVRIFRKEPGNDKDEDA